MPRTRWRITALLLELIGTGLACYGVARVSLAAALILLGVVLVVASQFLEVLL